MKGCDVFHLLLRTSHCAALIRCPTGVLMVRFTVLSSTIFYLRQSCCIKHYKKSLLEKDQQIKSVPQPPLTVNIVYPLVSFHFSGISCMFCII